MNVIEASGLRKTFHRGAEEVHALRGVSLSVEAGEFVSIVGSSGSGKTALLNLLGCLDTPTTGTLSINGIKVTNLPESQRVIIRREEIGFVFQQFFLIPTLSAIENILLPLTFSKKPIDETRAQEILHMVGLSHRADHLPHELSGGEMQRVAIGRALINDPRIILADEPTGNLDSHTAEQMYDIFEELMERGYTVIIVTHNTELAHRAHRIIHLRDGCLEPDKSCVCQANT
ncbi:putative ABC transporter ATP-binding protein YknY [anaerobic digester metagenome]